MMEYDWNILVGVTDRDEGADLSTHLIKYGWNADHCYSAEEMMDTLEDGEYDLVLLDEELVADSEWNVDELSDTLPGVAKVILLGEPGSVYPLESFGDRIRVIIRPFAYSTLHSLIELLLADFRVTSTEEDETRWTDEDLDLGLTFDDLEKYVTV